VDAARALIHRDALLPKLDVCKYRDQRVVRKYETKKEA